MKYNNAAIVAKTVEMGLSSRDLSELTGLSIRMIHYIKRGERKAPPVLKKLMYEIQEDILVIIDELIANVKEGQGYIPVFINNDHIRENIGIPGRGKAKGFFSSTYMIAAHNAQYILKTDYLIEDIPLVFFNKNLLSMD